MVDVDTREGEELGDEDHGDEAAHQPDEGQASGAIAGVGLLRNTWADAPPPMPEPAPMTEPGAEGPAPVAAGPRRRSLNPLIRLGHMLSGGPNRES